MRQGCLGLSVFVISLILVFLSLATESRAQNHSSQNPPTGITSGRMAIVDPITGQAISGERAIRNMITPESQAQLENFRARLRSELRTNFDGSGLEETRLANGAVKVDLKGRFRSSLVAISKSDKTVVITHEVPDQDSR